MKIIHSKSGLACIVILMLIACEVVFSQSGFLELKDGTKINGIIIDYQVDSIVKIKDNSSNILVFPSANIKKMETPFALLKRKDGTIEKDGRAIFREDGKILLKVKNSYDDVITFQDISIIVFYDEDDNLVKKEYLELGATLLLPAVLNAVVGYSFGRLGIRYHGMFWGNTHGHQLNLPVKFYETENVYHAVTPLVGYSRLVLEENTIWGPADIPYTWTYAGLAYNLNLYGFFFDLGATFGTGDFSSPQLLFSIGYVHRFNNK